LYLKPCLQTAPYDGLLLIIIQNLKDHFHAVRYHSAGGFYRRILHLFEYKVHDLGLQVATDPCFQTCRHIALGRLLRRL
jgi:hypothetical protein